MTRKASRIQAELKQRKPFRSLAQEASLALLRTTDVLRRKFSEVTASSDLTLQQYNVLRILRGAGPDGLPTLEIGVRMIEQAPGVTRLLDRLESKQLVLRVRCVSDRRQVFCHITDAGLALLGSLDGPVNDADEAAMSSLTRAETKTLIELLDKVRAANSE
jgi:DNA-binding MarR family transcriptional regulator